MGWQSWHGGHGLADPARRSTITRPAGHSTLRNPTGLNMELCRFGCTQFRHRVALPWLPHATKGQPSARLVILLNSVWLGIDSTINSRALLFDAVGGPGNTCVLQGPASEPLMGYLCRLRPLASSSLRTCCAWSLVWRHRCGKLSFRFWSFWYILIHMKTQKGWGSKSLFSDTLANFCLADYHPFRGLQVKVAGLQGQRDHRILRSQYLGRQYMAILECIWDPQTTDLDRFGRTLNWPLCFWEELPWKDPNIYHLLWGSIGPSGCISWTWRREDFWFVFDFLLAFLMVLETWVIAVAARQRSAEGRRLQLQMPMPWVGIQVLMVTGEDLFLIDTSVLRRVFFRPKNGILLPCEGEVCKIVQNNQQISAKKPQQTTTLNLVPVDQLSPFCYPLVN